MRWKKKMAVIRRGEIWVIDFGLAAKVRPALLLTGSPADDELDLVTVLLHTTALRGNQWELAISKPFLKPGAFHLQQLQTISTAKLERRLGTLTPDEMARVDGELARRLGLMRY
jgi:mRNA interferase MazF